jgi:AraC-like DNA-binding protein
MQSDVQLSLAYFLEPVTGERILCDRAVTRSLSLQDSFALIFVARGEILVDIEDARVPLDTHAAVLVGGAPTDRARLTLAAGTDAYLLEFRAASAARRARSGRGPSFARASMAGPELFTHTLRYYVAEANSPDPAQSILRNLLVLVLCQFASAADRVQDATADLSALETLASLVDAHIAAHYPETITTNGIARHLHYSPEYLERAYRRTRGVAIRSAIHSRRIKEASAHLRRERQMHVSDIAALCGYNDVAYFRRVFKSMTGMTPARFRSAGVAVAPSRDTSGAPAAVGGAGIAGSTRDRAPTPGTREAKEGTLALGRTQFTLTNGILALNAGLFVSPGFGIHATRVIDSYELIFVKQGYLDLFEEEMDFHVGPGQALLLCPGRRHGGRLPYPPDVQFYWVHFRLAECPRPHTRLRLPRVTDLRDLEMISEAFRRFISDQESGVLDAVRAAHLVGLMLCEVSESARTAAGPRAARSRTGPGWPLVQEIDAYIDHNYRRPISTSAIAKDLGRCSDYLERIYRRERDRTILQALHDKRITAARALLRNEDRKNITEIALECGYTVPGCFRRTFKRMTGLTPRQFRSLYSRTHINAH